MKQNALLPVDAELEPELLAIELDTELATALLAELDEMLTGGVLDAVLEVELIEDAELVAELAILEAVAEDWLGAGSDELGSLLVQPEMITAKVSSA